MTDEAKHSLSSEAFGCPPPSLSFIDAQRRRLSFRNERSLYTRTSDITGQPIISVYAPDAPFPVYEAEYWYGDQWDPLSYGQPVDFTRPFFDQFNELQLKVPRLALLNIKAENSAYCNMAYGNKNCYLVFGSDFNQDCMYGTLSTHNESCLDLDYSSRNNHCYELGDSINCYGCQFTFDSSHCTDCAFVSDCTNCSDCILCTNLVRKQYCIENQQYSKEEYLKRKAELLDGKASTQAELFRRFVALRSTRPVKYSHQINCERCTGDYLKNSKNCIHSFDVTESENLQNVIYASKAKDCLECSLLGEGTERTYNAASTLGCYNVKLSYFTIDSTDIEYSKYSFNSHNLFGCVGLRNRRHCILNMQYQENEYRELRDRLIAHMKKTGEWGQFFPPYLSDFAYNETSAHDYFPLRKTEAIARGYRWRDTEERLSEIATVEAPDDIADVTEDLADAVLRCADCGKNYKLVAQELRFYKEHSLPIPRLCEACRHARRASLRNPRQLWSRQCTECGRSVESSYAPDRPETIYCESCYQQAII